MVLLRIPVDSSHCTQQDTSGATTDRITRQTDGASGARAATSESDTKQPDVTIASSKSTQPTATAGTRNRGGSDSSSGDGSQPHGAAHRRTTSQRACDAIESFLNARLNRRRKGRGGAPPGVKLTQKDYAPVDECGPIHDLPVTGTIPVSELESTGRSFWRW